MKEYSNYQKKVIQRFYENRDKIDAQHLSELVTQIYLAEGKQQEKQWERARDIMLRLGVPEGRVQHVVDTRDPAILAEVVQDLESGKIGP